MKTLTDKINAVNEQMSKKMGDRYSNLLKIQEVYNDAVKKGLISEAKYDIPDPLKMEMLFNSKNNQ
jgi:hypothetical protein